MCFSTSVPSAPPIPQTPTVQDPSIAAAVNADQKRRAAANGMQSTFLTGGLGLTTPAMTQPKTLLGS